MIDEDLDIQAHSIFAQEAAACACLKPSICQIDGQVSNRIQKRRCLNIFVAVSPNSVLLTHTLLVQHGNYTLQLARAQLPGAICKQP